MDVYSLAFSVSNLGPKSYQRILKEFGSSEKAWLGGKNEYEKLRIKDKTYKKFDEFRKNFDIEKYIKKLEEKNVEFISFLDKDYSKGLKKLENPPIGIYLKGNKGLIKEKLSIGVVGTRKVTEYGKNTTQSLVEELAGADVCIISGLAMGVDAIAHRTALTAGGKTIAVLACGVDCCRPSENYNLYLDILKNKGLIISEYPLSSNAFKGTFLARNRIIAALSDGVLVTEAAEDSGSLVTARYSLSLSKKVFSVPGPISAQMSQGNLSLLKNGAVLVTETADILKEFKNVKIKNKKTVISGLNKDEKIVITKLEVEPLSVDELVKQLQYESRRLSILLSTLELRGIVTSSSGKWRIS